ncbi:hypothetical protein [Marinobacter sp.]|uniref:hypothetical protein n=1 Tax=Marinobacter sp. TaxID=50741 RepID=UPI000C923771|nr:hypothetical protein [Marinobacter sp.]MAB51362.1 hypothetical protein [Marinobacter sp.]|tara:strand:+ start:355 stop:897 length:543 start_codon:yes stop_codon:yes gene_type:complete
MAYKYSGRIVRAGKAWTDNDGIQHPANWMLWDDATKAAKGIVWEDDPASFDGRFYWSAGVAKALDDVNAVDDNGNAIMEDGKQVVTLGLKSNAISAVKAQAGGLLAPTDWMVVRSAENGTDIPTDVLAYRAAVRSASETIETAITNTADLAAFIALYDVPVDADGNPTGNAPINNWPDVI